MMTMSKAMRKPVLMRWRAWIILALLPWFAGCSAVRLGYGQGPTLAYWWLDGYADFSAEQAPRVKAALADWFAWHRASELPEYAQALAALQAQAVDNVTAAQVCGIYEGWQRRAERAFDQAVPALAEQVLTLSPAQIAHLERQQTRKLEEQRGEYLQPDPAERRKAAFERTLERAESIYGTLGEAQRRQLAADLAGSPFDAERWLAERRQRQQDSVRLLRQWQAERAEPATVQAGLRRLALESTRSPRTDYRAHAERLNAANCLLVARLHNGTSAVQRQRAVARLKGWEDDLRALAAP
jgi:hypothetical protein